MASNISSGGWRVKMVSIPASITLSELAQKIGLPKSRIYLPKANENKTYYAWIDGFVSEEEAHNFARQWSGWSILSGIIKCVVATPRVVERDALDLPRESMVSTPETLPNKPYQYRSNRGPQGRPKDEAVESTDEVEESSRDTFDPDTNNGNDNDNEIEINTTISVDDANINLEIDTQENDIDEEAIAKSNESESNDKKIENIQSLNDFQNLEENLMEKPMSFEILAENLDEDQKQECKPTKEDIAKRETLLNYLEREFRQKYSNCNIRAFGSFYNGFGLQQSDLDVCVLLELNSKETVIQVLENLAQSMESNKTTFQNIEIVRSARIPIIRSIHPHSNIEIDVSLNNILPIENTRLLKMYSDIDPRVRELGFVMKTLAKNHVWKGYGSNKLSSGALWIEFLRFYTERFDYEKNIVTIRQYEPLSRLEKGWFRRTIAIEDPFILTHNLADKLSLQS
ncbi:unnamed protein product [Rotaria sordida]|uniref:Uncharacterized protein n=1 Tax=Rotaria sordida TaxID=392033 RepID=A0A819KGW4_9BILA|nr:unnamed protein product [Rotaria sordida]